MPAVDLRAALDVLDNFERAVVEHDDRLLVEARRMRCLAILDGIIGGLKTRRVHGNSGKVRSGFSSGIA
ncbi:hypothetical protein [Mesorhizobium sp. B1-1-8]|uniref:hypothetical protein n=1 Tax=Mesorhizobium sp. B1-1-8 TaxID=2589976 RepID=UPI0011295F1F|nr:hypothetical protein [Mesorhizobium sp. B1-1-8]UCI06558.1 hypothetical protein FJ974_22510 [Mesorhizobium sp. B1-1-8]